MLFLKKNKTHIRMYKFFYLHAIRSIVASVGCVDHESRWEKETGEFITFRFMTDFNSVPLSQYVDESKKCFIEIKIEKAAIIIAF